MVVTGKWRRLKLHAWVEKRAAMAYPVFFKDQFSKQVRWIISIMTRRRCSQNSHHPNKVWSDLNRTQCNGSISIVMCNHFCFRLFQEFWGVLIFYIRSYVSVYASSISFQLGIFYPRRTKNTRFILIGIARFVHI